MDQIPNPDELLLKPKIEFEPNAMANVPPDVTEDMVKDALNNMFSCKQEICDIGTCIQVLMDEQGRFIPTGTPEDLSLPPLDTKLLVIGTGGLRRILEKANELGLAGKKMESLSHGLDGQRDLVLYVKNVKE
jgi:hypothetical protein